MAIIHSCCFWRNVRNGSFASAIYTLIYFACATVLLLQYIIEEQEYLMGKISKPTGESLLERGDVTPTTVTFNIIFLICSVCLVLSSAMAVIGVWKNKRFLLLPWVFFMVLDIFIELLHLIYLVNLQKLVFVPLVGVILTIDFFIMCLNVYCLLCVISQYQILKIINSSGDATYAIAGNTAQTTQILRPKDDNAAVSPYICNHTNFSTVPEESQSQLDQSLHQNIKEFL